MASSADCGGGSKKPCLDLIRSWNWPDRICRGPDDESWACERGQRVLRADPSRLPSVLSCAIDEYSTSSGGAHVDADELRNVIAFAFAVVDFVIIEPVSASTPSLPSLPVIEQAGTLLGHMLCRFWIDTYDQLFILHRINAMTQYAGAGGPHYQQYRRQAAVLAAAIVRRALCSHAPLLRWGSRGQATATSLQRYATAWIASGFGRPTGSDVVVDDRCDQIRRQLRELPKAKL